MCENVPEKLLIDAVEADWLCIFSAMILEKYIMLDNYFSAHPFV